MLLFMLAGLQPAFGQNGVAIAASTATADPSAMLDVQSTSKGALVPRMTNAQRAAISLPANALLVFCTDAPSGYYYNAGTTTSINWVILSAGALTGTGTTNYISKWTASGVLGNSMVFDNGTNVGIGTASSTTNTLTVNGAGALWNSNELKFYTDAGSTLKGFIGNYTSGSDFSIASTVSGTWLRIGSNAATIAFFPDNTINGGASPLVSISAAGVFQATTLAGTGTRPVWADASGNLNNSGRSFNVAGTTVTNNDNNWHNLVSTTITVAAGEVIQISGSAYMYFPGGSGNDRFQFQLTVTGSTSATLSSWVDAWYESISHGYNFATPFTYTWQVPAGVSGSTTFNLQGARINADDGWISTSSEILVVKE